jgi:small conductance mechanosensitive channel
MAFPTIYDVLTSPLAISLIQVAVTILITFLIVRLYRIIIQRAAGSVPSGLLSSLQQIGSWAIWILGTIIVLSQLDVPINMLLLILFLGGSALIVAYRNILTDMAASQFISTYQSFKVGEWIQVQDYYGRVIERNLIQTKILTPDNEIVVVPNSTLLRRSVVNRSRSGGLRVQIPVTVDGKFDLKEVEKNLLDIGQEMKTDLVPDAPPQVRVSQATSQRANLVLMLRITNPAKRDQLISDVQEKFYERLPGLDMRKQPF